jgi:hypothetical protein
MTGTGIAILFSSAATVQVIRCQSHVRATSRKLSRNGQSERKTKQYNRL